MLIRLANESQLNGPADLTKMSRYDVRGPHGNSLANILSMCTSTKNNPTDTLALNVLLLGDRQSGRSSVGNALIGGHEFPTGMCAPGVSMTMECQLLSRNFPRYFRRQGVESDLLLRVIDTPPQIPNPQCLQELCPGGVHVLVLVMRSDLPPEMSHLQESAQSLFGPEWRRHTFLIFTYANHLMEAGLHPSEYLNRTSDWLRSLAQEVRGGVCFLDNSHNWPSITGQPLRERVLHLSAKNHHKALRVRMEVSS